MTLDRAYQSGIQTAASRLCLLEFPGLARVEWKELPAGTELEWLWDTRERFYHIFQGFPEWPGPDDYYVQYTWKASEGILRLFINGIPMRLPDARFRIPWTFQDEAATVRFHAGAVPVSDLNVESRYTETDLLLARVPESLRGRHAELLSFKVTPDALLCVADLKGDLIYSNDLASAENVQDWVMEGPGLLEFSGGWLSVSSAKPDAAAPDHGHSVYWMPRILPDSFVAEWDVQLLSDTGLLIVFFAAQGRDGRDLFDPALALRDGSFRQYNNGDIECYHISYYSNPEHEPGRTTSNLRKNPPAMMVYQGPVGIEPGSSKIHHVQLIKSGNAIQMAVDGRIIVRWEDVDEARFGPALTEGRIGFRQMQWTQVRYRNLRIHRLDSGWTALRSEGGCE